MRIYLAASPAIMIYNYGTSVISVSGDSVRPLYYMMISGGLNVVLNFILCWIMPQKVAAVAIASVVSQVVGALLVLQNLARSKDMCRWDLRHPSWSGSSFGRLMANGIPLALNSAMAPLANLQIQSAVNSLGSSVMAGNSASLYIESLENSLSATPLSAATTAFVGQNIGAKKPRRVRDTILYSLALGVGISLILSTLAMCFSEPLASLFVGSDPAAIEATQIRMSFIVQFYFMCVVNSVVGHAIQAFGYPTFATVANIVGVLLFRFFWMTVIYPTYSGFFSVCLCFLVSWVLTMIGQGIFLLYVYFGKFKKGTLKSM
jgi:Na+-driven multidrug efflux pump